MMIYLPPQIKLKKYDKSSLRRNIVFFLSSKHNYVKMATISPTEDEYLVVNKP